MPSVGVNVREDDVKLTEHQQENFLGDVRGVSIGVNVHEEDFVSKTSAQSSRKSSANRSSQESLKPKAVVHSLESLIPTSARHKNEQPCRLTVDKQQNRPNMRFRSKTEILSFDPDDNLKTWQCLESMRIKKLGLPPERHSERYGVVRAYTHNKQRQKVDIPRIRSTDAHHLPNDILVNSPRNDFAPFITNKKPTCGFFYSDDTNHRKPKLDVDYVDVVRWRSHQKKPAVN